MTLPTFLHYVERGVLREREWGSSRVILECPRCGAKWERLRAGGLATAIADREAAMAHVRDEHPEALA